MRFVVTGAFDTSVCLLLLMALDARARKHRMLGPILKGKQRKAVETRNTRKMEEGLRKPSGGREEVGEKTW